MPIFPMLIYDFSPHNSFKGHAIRGPWLHALDDFGIFPVFFLYTHFMYHNLSSPLIYPVHIHNIHNLNHTKTLYNFFL
jgi:hypothetical protein